MNADARKKLLEAFCSDGRLPQLESPFVMGDFVYASNGAAILRMVREVADGVERRVISNVKSYFSHGHIASHEWEAVEVLPPRFWIGNNEKRRGVTGYGDAAPCVMVQGAWFQVTFLGPLLELAGPLLVHLCVLEEKSALLVKRDELQAVVLPCMPGMKPVAID